MEDRPFLNLSGLQEVLHEEIRQLRYLEIGHDQGGLQGRRQLLRLDRQDDQDLKK